jgi:hypothetical protein
MSARTTSRRADQQAMPLRPAIAACQTNPPTTSRRIFLAHFT